ncbi:MAG: DMT family transporter [Acidilobaceae archaeon]
MKRIAMVAGGVLVASVSFSLASILIKYSLALGAQPATLAAWRLLIASSLTLILLKVLKIGGRSPSTASKPVVIALTLIGGLLLGIHMVLWKVSLGLTSVAVAATIVNLYPLVMVLVDNLVFNTKLRTQQYLGLALALSAAVTLTLTLERDGGDVLGAVAAFASMLGVAGYLTVGKLLRDAMSALEYTFYAYLLGGVLALTYSLVAGYGSLLPLEAIPLAILLAILPTLLGHTLINALARITSLTVASIPPLLEPAGASLLAWMLLGESLPAFRALAVAMAVCGAALVVSAEDRRES